MTTSILAFGAVYLGLANESPRIHFHYPTQLYESMRSLFGQKLNSAQHSVLWGSWFHDVEQPRL